MVVWIAFYVIALCSTSEVGGALISYIYESPFLTYIYENNLIVALIMMFYKNRDHRYRGKPDAFPISIYKRNLSKI